MFERFVIDHNVGVDDGSTLSLKGFGGVDVNFGVGVSTPLRCRAGHQISTRSIEPVRVQDPLPINVGNPSGSRALCQLVAEGFRISCRGGTGESLADVGEDITVVGDSTLQ